MYYVDQIQVAKLTRGRRFEIKHRAIAAATNYGGETQRSISFEGRAVREKRELGTYASPDVTYDIANCSLETN